MEVKKDLEDIFNYFQISEKNKGICRLEDLASVLGLDCEDLIVEIQRLESQGKIGSIVSGMYDGAYLIIWPISGDTRG